MNSSRPKILLVDDDPSVLVTVGDLLEAEGFAVTRAASTDEALRSAGQKRPDLVILDIGMPGKSGMAFLKEITLPTRKLKFPVLVFTARSGMDEFFDGQLVDGVVIKTADPTILLKEANRVLARHGRPRPARPPSGAAGRILIAEDEKAVGERLVRLFNEAGLQAACLAAGDALVEAAVRQPPGVILAKFILPGANASLIASMLGSLPSTRRIPIVIYDDSGMLRDKDLPPNVKRVLQRASDALVLSTVTEVLAEAAKS